MSYCFNSACLWSNSSDIESCEKCGNPLLLNQRYRVENILGEGILGNTFLAVDESNLFKKTVVIKQFYPQKEAELFQLEFSRLQELGKFPQIPELLDYFSQDGYQYLVQEYIEGENLAKILESQGYFSESKIRHLLKNLLPVLEFIHSQQIIHRDIQPKNIIQTQNGQLVLVDFCWSKYVTQIALPVTGTSMITAEYAAPERAMGKAIYGSDLYSLGVSCLHLLTQVRPVDLFDLGEMEWGWRKYIKTSISSELADILDKMTQIGSKKRYQSATEVLLALDNQSPELSIQLLPKLPLELLPQTSSQIVRQDTFRSAWGDVDYTHLRDLLAQGKWKEADEETLEVMLKAARQHRDKDRFFNKKVIDRFPCEDLETIDQLWVKYSQGRFGFSIQKKIWLEVGGKFGYPYENEFAYRVGWETGGGRWLDYDELIFDWKAPRGQFPCFGTKFVWNGKPILGSKNWGGWCFFQRMDQCNL